MAISTEEALKMVDESLGSAAPQASETTDNLITPAQTSAADENKDDGVNAEPAETKDRESDGTDGEEHVSNAKDEKSSSNGKKSRRKYQDRVNYSFMAMKKQLAEKDRRIAELEKKYELTSKLEKSDFSNDAEYQKNLVDNELDRRELERLKSERVSDSEEINANEFLAGIRVKASEMFNNDEMDHFERLTSEKSYNLFAEVVNAHDPEGIVGDYLADSKNAPLLLRTLMTKPEILKRVLDCKLPQNKFNELRTLERNIEIRTRIAATKKKATEKKPLPVLGSMTKTDTKGEPTSYDDKWGEEYLKAHKSGRF